MSVRTTPVLSSAQVEQYDEQGYTTANRVMSAPEFDALRAYFEERFAELGPDQRPEDMDVPHFTDPSIFRWLFNADILDMVEQLIGPDIALFSSHFFCKPAGDGKSVPLHQDAYFWQKQIVPAEQALTVWLAIDPSDLGNGCLTVVPGSHRVGIVNHGPLDDSTSVFDEAMSLTATSAEDAVPIQLAPNELSIHNAALVHSSARNTSPRRRCGFTMRYMSTRVRFDDVAAGQYHTVYLARGKDHAGNTYGDPERAYPKLIEARRRDNMTHMN